MTLLVEVMESPLDAGYAQEATRRQARMAAGATRRRSAWAWGLILLAAIGAGLTVTTAARQLSVPQEGGAASARDVLERQISERNEAATTLAARAEELAGEIENLQREALDYQDTGLLDTIQRDTLRNGTQSVQGPGLVISLTDGVAGLGEDLDPDALVQDQDLRAVVNTLWAAGAEAISIDDHRLTATSSIRNANQAVLVNLVPLAGPTYVVRAIGDIDAMQAAIAESKLPARLQALGNAYGIRSSIVAQSSLFLPGAGVQPLTHAGPVESLP